MAPTTAFRCKSHVPESGLQLTLRFSSRRPRKFYCVECNRRTWWVPEDSISEEFVATVKRDTRSSAVIYVHHRWIGRKVRVVPVTP
jgi:hypothetical protein